MVNVAVDSAMTLLQGLCTYSRWSISRSDCMYQSGLGFWPSCGPRLSVGNRRRREVRAIVIAVLNSTQGRWTKVMDGAAINSVGC